MRSKARSHVCSFLMLLAITVLCFVASLKEQLWLSQQSTNDYFVNYAFWINRAAWSIGSEARSGGESTDFNCKALTPPEIVTSRSTNLSFITSYYFDHPTKSLFLISLGKIYFTPRRGRNNFAINHTFPYESLVPPNDLFPRAKWGDEYARCILLRVGLKDSSMADKVPMVKCSFTNSSTDIEIYLVANDSSCRRLIIHKGPQGMITDVTKRPLLTYKDPKAPKTFTLCIAGVSDFQKDVVDLINVQFDRLQLDHVYIGLNTEDAYIRDSYKTSFKGLESKVTLSGPCPRQEFVTFSQGKLQFLNECLFHAKYHKDFFLGIWDTDEVLYLSDYVVKESLSQRLERLLGQRINSTCYVNIKSETFLGDPYMIDMESDPRNVAEKYTYRSVKENCGNYTKAISLVPYVDYLGLHTPEVCTFFPVGKGFRTKNVPFVSTFPSLTMIHFFQFWTPWRAAICPSVKDESLIDYLGLPPTPIIFQPHNDLFFQR